MGQWLPLLITLPFVVILLASGAWANRRFARFEELPGHYDFKGRATRMTPRRTMAWMLPIVFSIMLVFIAALSFFVLPELQNGSPVVGALMGGFALIGGQALVLWLTERWARSQDAA